MDATTVAVDLAKNVFQLAVADRRWRIVHTARLSRAQFAHWFDNRTVGLVVMEACGSADHWARVLQARGIEVRLLPARYIRPYVKRNKTDAADAAALLEAARCSDIVPVKVKSIEQQCLQGLHRVRAGWMATRTVRINALRGLCRAADSGGSRHLGRISKRGDHYLRVLLTHGARSVLNAAALARRRQKPADPLRTWALGLAQRSHHNKATCALANKLARICYAVLRDQEPYAARTVFANAA